MMDKENNSQPERGSAEDLLDLYKNTGLLFNDSGSKLGTGLWEQIKRNNAQPYAPAESWSLTNEMRWAYKECL